MTVSYNLSKALAKMGHDITVFTSDTIDEHTRQKEQYVEREGVKIYYFRNISNSLAWRRFFLYPGMISALKGQIKSFDIVHLHDTRNFQNIVAAHYAKKFRIPYVVQPHGSLPRIISKQRLKKIYDIIWGNNILKNASKIVAVSSTEAEQFKQAGIPQGKIVIIPNGINTTSFADFSPPGGLREQHGINGKHIILYVGRINKLKGIDFLIRAYKLFLQTWTGEDVTLIIGGPDDNYRPTLDKLVKQLGLSEKIKFIGPVKCPTIAYRDADVLVYPSMYEIFGLVPFEALLCGTPVIVTGDCGCGEIIREAKCGYLIRYGDEASLSEALRYVLTNPEENKKMVESGKKHIEGHLTWENVVKQVEKLYEDCIHNY